MSAYEQHQAPAGVYPPPSNAYPPPAEGYPAPAYSAPPPAGYPTKEGVGYPPQAPVETREKGDGFWEGCCAALCCCCALDMCC